MEFGKYNELITELKKNITDDKKVTEILVTLQDDYSEVLKTTETLTSTLEDTKKHNENLRQSNMDLFLKVGEQAKAGFSPLKINEQNTEKEPLKFEELFNEKGELK